MANRVLNQQYDMKAWTINSDLSASELKCFIRWIVSKKNGQLPVHTSNGFCTTLQCNIGTNMLMNW